MCILFNAKRCNAMYAFLLAIFFFFYKKKVLDGCACLRYNSACLAENVDVRETSIQEE